MSHAFATIAFTPAVRQAQARDGSRARYARAFESEHAVRHAYVGPDEESGIPALRTFDRATVSDTGWLYVQRRGGDPGFLRVSNPPPVSVSELPGNRQFIRVRNLTQ